MPRPTLKKDAGVGQEGGGFPAMVLRHRTEQADGADGVDAVLTAAAAAGGRITAETVRTERGDHGHFADPDGFFWRVADY
ncbi:hypothetical protein [Streptomyces oceani]|uniref:hypothetical protein n=1 Tax=Streptomyces oceani TaxID=1075402 RepID=UPI0009A0BEB2|nr:hypothetical protein [Streptomyces oceani]